MDLTIFGTPDPAFNEGMNYLGVSPGPKSLKEFIFYH